MSTLQIIEITDERQEAQTDILKTQYAEKNILLSVRRSCFVAPGLEAWERLFPGHREPGPGHSETSASSVEDGSWSSPSEDTQDHNIHLSIKLSKKVQNEYVMPVWLCADHLEVLLDQALEFVLQLLDTLSQIIVPLTQKLVLVQQGFTLLLWLSNSLQLVGTNRHRDVS